MADATNFTRKLHHKRVVILGGTSGIGYAVAEAAAEHGMFVTISSSQQRKVDASLASLAQSYPSAKSEGRLAGHVCDLGDSATVESNIEALLQKASEGGKLDHVIHTAGDALAIGNLADMTLEKMQRAGLVRYFSAQLLAKHATAHLVPRGSITFTTGQVSEKPMPGWGSINGFATGIHGSTRGLALDLKPIRVNAVSPGAVDTPLWDGLPPGAKEQIMESMKDGMATGQVGQARDVAEAYLYLMKDANVTGSIVRTDGGALLM